VSHRVSRARRPAGAALTLVAFALALAPTVFAGEASTTPPPANDPASAAIRFYQRYLSSLRHGRCRFQPSCSQYALEAIERYGLVAGTARAADRLIRCDRSSERFYARATNGRMIDPVAGVPPDPNAPRVPAWLLPPEPSPIADQPFAVREQIDFARSLAREGDCDRAATEFRRAGFLAGTAEAEAWCRGRVGACRFAAESWAVAEPEFLSAAMLTGGAAERRDATVMAAACRFNSGDFSACGAILDGVAGGVSGDAAAPAATNGDAITTELPPDATARARSLGLLGLSALARGNWSVAHDCFQQGITTDPGGEAARRLAVLSARSGEGSELPRKRHRLATALSIVIPGAGQIYAGRTGEGLRHLFFNGALIYSIVKLVQAEHVPAAVVVGAFETPFYLGNVSGAHNAATGFNRSKRMEFVVNAVGEASR
jgi:putative membrane protein insertion efficiency factor